MSASAWEVRKSTLKPAPPTRTKTVWSPSPSVTTEHDLTGLTPNTNYTYRAFATTSSGTVYGNEEEFTTDAAAITPPTATINCSAIGNNKVRITISNINLNGQGSGTAIVYYSWAWDNPSNWIECANISLNQEEPIVQEVTMNYDDHWVIKVVLDNGAINDGFQEQIDVY